MLAVCAGTAVSVVCFIYFTYHFVGTGGVWGLDLLLPIAEIVRGNEFQDYTFCLIAFFR